MYLSVKDLLYIEIMIEYKIIDFVEYYPNTLRGQECGRTIKIKMQVKLAAKMLVIVYPACPVKREACLSGVKSLLHLFNWGLDFNEKTRGV